MVSRKSDRGTQAALPAFMDEFFSAALGMTFVAKGSPGGAFGEPLPFVRTMILT